jgi:hypothetical protein
MAEFETAMPYAPPATVMSVIQRHRQVAIPQFDIATLQRIGVSDSLAPRTLQSLRLLGLVDDDGRPTDAFETLRKAATAEFHEVLESILRSAYSPVFAILDPTTASGEEVEDAFRHFVPSGQRSRMVTLFTGLLREAHVLEGAPSKSTAPKRSAGTPSRRVSKKAAAPTSASEPTESVEAERPSPAAPRYGEGDTYRVQLRSGGSVSIVMDVNLFLMSTADREFVIDLVDRMKGYEPDTTSSSESSVGGSR